MTEEKKKKLSPTTIILTSGALVILIIAILLPKTPDIEACKLHDMSHDNVDIPLSSSTALENDEIGKEDNVLDVKNTSLLSDQNQIITAHILSYLLAQNMQTLIQQEKPFLMPLQLLRKQNLNDTVLKLIEIMTPYAETGVFTPQSLTGMLKDAHIETVPEFSQETSSGFLSKIKSFFTKQVSVEKRESKISKEIQNVTWNNIKNIIEDIDAQEEKTPELQSWLESAKATVNVREIYQALTQELVPKEAL